MSGPARKRVAARRGAPLSDTWNYGVNWAAQSASPLPSARAGQGAVYDHFEKQMFVFGGYPLNVRPAAPTR